MAPTTQDDMFRGHDLSVLIALTSLASLTSFIIVVFICVCCYGKRDDESDFGDFDEVKYQNIDAADSPEPRRSDLKTLNKHHALQAPSRTIEKSSLLSPKSIVFDRPVDKRFVTENVQPDQFSQSSLNSRLGLGRGDPNARGSAGASGTWNPLAGGRGSPSPSAGGVGSSQSSPALSTRLKYGLVGSKGSDGAASVNSSPFHKILDTNNQAGGAASDDLPNNFDEPDYFVGGEKLGKLQFNLSYDFQETTLTLRIIRAVDLPAKDFSGTSDPYVKILLLPDKKSKLTTNIKRRNLNPRWNEIFAFEGFAYSKLMNRTLYMQVLDYDRFSRDDPIGEVCLPLSDIDLAQSQTMWRSLSPCKGHAGKLGELLLSICYQPSDGRITIVIIKARELKAKDINGLSDPYVKVWMCHEGKKVEKKKTTIKEKNLNPVFNESFIFNVPYENIRKTTLSISVMDYDRLGRNELIGQVILGSKSGPMEVKHWNEMFAKSRQPVAQWHILKDFS